MLTEKSRDLFSLDDIEYMAGQIVDQARPLGLEDARFLLSQCGPTHPLSPQSAARFLASQDPRVTETFLQRAKDVKEMVFDRRIVIFAPLYLSNRCHNNCLYCGFRMDNRSIDRITLTPSEAARESALLADKGYTRLLLVTGEQYDGAPSRYITGVIDEIYKHTSIRILHLNAAPMPSAELKEIKKAGAGVYQVFQETYHRKTYKIMHPRGKKSDYLWRLSSMDRAIPAGFDDVGIGALLGLHEWKFEAIATIIHALYLKDHFGAWPHTISVPRLKPAKGSAISSPPSRVSDTDFLKTVAAYRLCAPAAGVVVSTREPGWLREKALDAGASQISAGSSTSPGGYGNKSKQGYGEGQFETDDKRQIDEIMNAIIDRSHIPSLCTSCYRSNRTGKVFSHLAVEGKMDHYCLANALLSLAEYAQSVTGNMLKKRCTDIIKSESTRLPGGMRSRFMEKLEAIERGHKDERF